MKLEKLIVGWLIKRPASKTSGREERAMGDMGSAGERQVWTPQELVVVQASESVSV